MDILTTFAGFGWPLSLALIPLFGFLDRFWGSDGGFKGKKAVILVLAIVGPALALGLAGGLMGLAWVIYRSLPFFASSATKPASALIRHGVVIPAALLVAFWTDHALDRAGFAFGASTLCAVALAAFYGAAEREAIEEGRAIGDANTLVEVARGLAFGLALAFGLT